MIASVVVALLLLGAFPFLLVAVVSRLADRSQRQERSRSEAHRLPLSQIYVRQHDEGNTRD